MHVCVYITHERLRATENIVYIAEEQFDTRDNRVSSTSDVKFLFHL